MTKETESGLRDEEMGLFPLSVTNRSYKIVFNSFLLIFTGFLLYHVRKFPDTDQIFPYVIGIPVFGILAIHVVLLAFPSLEKLLTPERVENIGNQVDEMLEEVVETDTGRSIGERQLYEVLMIGWLILLGLLLLLFGFAILPVFLLFFWHFLINDVKFSLLLTVIFTVISYFLFIHFLKMVPWTGILEIPIYGV